MKTADLFNPPANEVIACKNISAPFSVGNRVGICKGNDALTPGDAQICIIGIPDSDETGHAGTAGAPDIIRQEFYRLVSPDKKMIIRDFGNLIISGNKKDNYAAARIAIAEILEKKTSLLILGGTAGILQAVYDAYAAMKRKLSLLEVAPRVSFSANTTENELLVNRIIRDKRNYLANYTNLGYQQYYNDPAAIEGLKEIYFDAIRLGESRNDLSAVEPLIRDCNVFSVDISCVRQSDAPAHHNPSPNGYYSEELCRLARYAGLGNNVDVFLISEMNPEYDHNGQTAGLAAQACWYYTEGMLARNHDHPSGQPEKFVKFNVAVENFEHSFIFYKHRKTEKWWMEIPCTEAKKNSVIVSCTFADYKAACDHHVPDRWWRNFQKIN
ncbi:MAG: arginase family protein [Bacteroidota bacterium]